MWARYNLGLVYIDNEQYEEAAKQYKAMLGIVPNDGLAQTQLGVALMKSGEREKAVSYFDKAIKNLAGKNGLENAYLNKGICLEEMKDKKGALECYQKYKSLGGSKAEVNEWIDILQLAVAEGGV
jgi:tetratricopeptide (TPR) repeat protein